MEEFLRYTSVCIVFVGKASGHLPRLPFFTSLTPTDAHTQTPRGCSPGWMTLHCRRGSHEKSVLLADFVGSCSVMVQVSRAWILDVRVPIRYLNGFMWLTICSGRQGPRFDSRPSPSASYQRRRKWHRRILRPAFAQWGPLVPQTASVHSTHAYALAVCRLDHRVRLYIRHN